MQASNTPEARREAPPPRREETVPPPRRRVVMDFSMGIATRRRAAEPAPSEPAKRMEEPAERPKEPEERAAPPERQVARRRVARASRRRAPRRRRNRASSGACGAASAGMRFVRLLPRGMSLGKIMIRVKGAALTPNEKGCIQVPAAVKMVMLAYKPDVTAYHLCQVRLSSRKSTVRFKLVDANIAPPADGDCSK
ncbi:MAG: hypothetical protein H6727_05535 [Myxococcales bacterium]|nr:hypothetical protein [Myxococcales bacterium]